MNISSLRLSNGSQLPVLGLGLWKVERSAAPTLIEQAARAGWRHFDCAIDFGNEAAVGVGLQNVLQSKSVRREDLWVTSKLWNTNHKAEHVRAACERSLRD